MQTNKKFIDTIRCDDFEILTDIGFVELENVMKTIKYKKYIIYFSDGNVIECADEHLLIKSDDEPIYAKDSLGSIIKTMNGLVTVTEVEECNSYENMYDLQLTKHHKFYTNGVLSHNTTIVAAYLLHQALFNPNYNIALLANKKDQSAEVLDRIKTMYENLPWWLQVGVRRWNVNDIRLDIGKKGSSIFTAATSGSSVRGKSINCLSGESVVTIKDESSGQTYDIDIESLYHILEEDDVEVSDER